MLTPRLVRRATTALLVLMLPCCTNDTPQPQGSYTLDPETTFGFTKTRLVMKGGHDPEAAASLAHRLIDSARGTAALGSDGTASLRVHIDADDERELDGTWRLDDRQLICSATEDPSKTWTLTYVDGSDALHQIVQIGDHRAELVFLPTRR